MLTIIEEVLSLLYDPKQRARSAFRQSYNKVSDGQCRGNKGLEELSSYVEKLVEESLES